MLLNLGLMRCGSRPKSFGTVRNAVPSTVEDPATYTSRRCYFTVATGTAFVLPAGASVRFNDSGAWISANGNTPAGAKFWRCRGESSTDYETAVTLTPTLNGVNYPFMITTMAEPQVHLDELTVEEIDAMTISEIDPIET